MSRSTPSGTRQRKRRRTSPRRLSVWRNLASVSLRLGLWLVALALMVVVFNKVWHPIGLNRNLENDVTQARRDLEQVRAENEALRRRQRYLNTPEGIQSEARKLGYINQGEVPLRLQEPPPPVVPPAERPSSDS